MPEIVLDSDDLSLDGATDDLGVIVNDCETEITDSVEMDLFKKMTNMFMNTEIKDIALTVGKNIIVSGVDVYRELSAAYTNFFAKQYE